MHGRILYKYSTNPDFGSLKLLYQWRRKGELEGLEPPQLSTKGGRAPPKIYACDVINIS